MFGFGVALLLQVGLQLASVPPEVGVLTPGQYNVLHPVFLIYILAVVVNQAAHALHEGRALPLSECKPPLLVESRLQNWFQCLFRLANLTGPLKPRLKEDRSSLPLPKT